MSGSRSVDADEAGPNDNVSGIFTHIEDEVLVELRCRFEGAIQQCKNNPTTAVWKHITECFLSDPRVDASKTWTPRALSNRFGTLFRVYAEWNRSMDALGKKVSGSDGKERDELEQNPPHMKEVFDSYGMFDKPNVRPSKARERGIAINNGDVGGFLRAVQTMQGSSQAMRPLRASAEEREAMEAAKSLGLAHGKTPVKKGRQWRKRSQPDGEDSGPGGSLYISAEAVDEDMDEDEEEAGVDYASDVDESGNIAALIDDSSPAPTSLPEGTTPPSDKIPSKRHRRRRWCRVRRTLLEDADESE